MKLNKKTALLVAKLEKIIGSSCYNPNSYNGYTQEYGQEFKYPVWATTRYGHKAKYSYGIESAIRSMDINHEDVDSLFYKFGSNHLHIGEAIVSVLEYLEREYDLDFEKLVAKADPTKKYKNTPQIDVLRKAVSMIESQSFEYNVFVEDGVTRKIHEYTYRQLFSNERILDILSEEFYMPQVFRGLKKSRYRTEGTVCSKIYRYHLKETNHIGLDIRCYSDEVNAFVDVWRSSLIPKILSGSIKESDLGLIMRALNSRDYSIIYWWEDILHE